MKYIKLFINLSLVLTIAILALVQFVLSNELAADNDQLLSLNESTQKVNQVNAYYAQQLAVAKSLSVLEEKAENFGFYPKRELITIEKEADIALGSQ